jgi:hypothetical protein
VADAARKAVDELDRESLTNGLEDNPKWMARLNAQIPHSEDFYYSHILAGLLLRNRCAKIGRNKIEGT